MGRYGRQLRSAQLTWMLAFACALWLGTSQVSAQAPGEARPDVRVVVDVSGSMKENDPERLALSALDMLVALLPNGATAGVWTFGETVDNPLPLGQVDAAWRERALGLPPALQDYQQYTDIEAALRAAASPDADGWRHLVLLTDGMIDLPPAEGDKAAADEASRRRLVDDLAGELAAQGVSIHAIAFSDQADLALAERLAQATGGLVALAEDPERLLGAFLDIVERIFPADQLPLQDGRFTVDAGVETFTALIFHEPGDAPLTLMAPDGSRFQADTVPEALRWQVEPRFDLIRVPNPQVGVWQLEGTLGEGSRVNVGSPLQLRTAALPTTLYLGFPVPVVAWVERDGAPLDAAGAALTLTASLQDATGQVQSQMALEVHDGRFRGRLPAPALTGNARLVILADGASFQRQREQAVNVLPAIAAMHQPRQDRVVLAAEHPRLSRHNTVILARLQGESLTAEPVGDARWHLALPDLDEALSQPLLLTARITLDGETRELSLPRLLLNPQGRVGVDVANVVGPTLRTARVAEPEPDTTRSPADEAADGFMAWANHLPEAARKLWQIHHGDPRLWGTLVVALLVVIVWLVISLIRRRHRRRPAPREEPHV